MKKIPKVEGLNMIEADEWEICGETPNGWVYWNSATGEVLFEGYKDRDWELRTPSSRDSTRA